MKFTSKVTLPCTARLGVLSEIERLPNLSYQTPLLLIYTKRGCIPHLCKDVFKMLSPEKCFLLASLPSTLLMAEYIKEFNHFSEYEYPLFLTIQDPAECTKSGFHKHDSISVWSRNGRLSINPDRYMNVVEIFKPDMYVSLCDGDTDKNSSQKRINKAIEKSKNFFDKCMQRHVESNVLKNKGFLAPIEGGYNLQAREKCIKYMKDKPILGYIIDGLHKNGIDTQNIYFDEIKHVIQHSLNLLPGNKLRIMLGCWNPSAVLDLINLGVDVFDSTYPFMMTEEKKALLFSCTSCTHQEQQFVNLSFKKYRDNFTPICKSCHCATCKNYTKAYIHHLIQVKELLAQVLLMIHNVHHYIEFFKTVRIHIKDGTFQEYKNKIQSKYSMQM
ncbi:PREDICTED: queuine tRNA-ribosyltransferase subunit QTRTD1 homolog isoform X2 [Ceratosolen solmsi marchali]|uniref:Queuine tRNA-ribosyltransferase accessory subunit 2 n=1 Tax=Ceratosolen solmsi marchali TaxID=326594 RepID=A0AAJ6VMY2_9HYME|nr:PREDICTED: queuine tRNA-ribosyltransferase subunit QTRTD1 homolog isoform X2 [Ceratosolen solmsi marchali]